VWSTGNGVESGVLMMYGIEVTPLTGLQSRGCLVLVALLLQVVEYEINRRRGNERNVVTVFEAGEYAN
jgi:hypothetical protein